MDEHIADGGRVRQHRAGENIDVRQLARVPQKRCRLFAEHAIGVFVADDIDTVIVVKHSGELFYGVFADNVLFERCAVTAARTAAFAFDHILILRNGIDLATALCYHYSRCATMRKFRRESCTMIINLRGNEQIL